MHKMYTCGSERWDPIMLDRVEKRGCHGNRSQERTSIQLPVNIDVPETEGSKHEKSSKRASLRRRPMLNREDVEKDGAHARVPHVPSTYVWRGTNGGISHGEM